MRGFTSDPALDDYAPSTISRVYGSHGEVIGEFTQRREVIPRRDSPKPAGHHAAEDSGSSGTSGPAPHIVMAATRDVSARYGPITSDR
jgi:membrane carboxypeptidase/penicillin-binding protein